MQLCLIQAFVGDAVLHRLARIDRRRQRIAECKGMEATEPKVSDSYHSSGELESFIGQCEQVDV